MSETVSDALRPVVLIAIFGALGLALGSAVCPDSLWAPGLVLIGACVGGGAEAAWVLARCRNED
jgi:hypothetical protein